MLGNENMNWYDLDAPVTESTKEFLIRKVQSSS